MVKSIKKPTKMKKYKGKRKDRKYRTAKKKLLPRRTFKKKGKKQQRGGAQSMAFHLTGTASTSAQTPNYRPFEEFFYEDKWEQPSSSDTISHFTKVTLDIAHDFHKILPDDYGETCIKLIENFQNHNVGANLKYYNLLTDWENSSKTTKERFLLLHCLSILDPTLLETALSIFKIKIGTDAPDITRLKGPETDNLFLNDLYFITDAFGSSSVFEALIDFIDPDGTRIQRPPITGVNKNYSNIFDPASLAQEETFLEEILLNSGTPTPALSPGSIPPVDQDTFKSYLQESTQLFFDSVVKFGTTKDYVIEIIEISHPAIVLTIDSVYYVHIHGDNSISAMKNGDPPNLEGYKRDALEGIQREHSEVKRLYEFFISSFTSNSNNRYLKYSYKSFGDWVQTIYTKKLDTYLNGTHGHGRSEQNGTPSKLGVKSLDKYVFSDVMLGLLPLIASSIYLGHLVDKDESDGDESDGEKEGIITFFGSQIHNSSLHTFSVFESVMRSFDFTVPYTWKFTGADGNVSVLVPDYDLASYNWLDKIKFLHATNNWETIKNGETDENFLKKIVDICSAYNQFVKLSEEVNCLGRKMNSMMESVSLRILDLQTKLEKSFTGGNVDRLVDLLEALKDPKDTLIALKKILIVPCINTLTTYNIKIPAPHELKTLVTTTDKSAGHSAQLAYKVQLHNVKPGRTSSRLINAVKIHAGMTQNKDVLKARASKAAQTNTQVITDIYKQVSGVTGRFHGGAAENKEHYMEVVISDENEFILIQEPEPDTCTSTAEYLFLIEIYAAHNACSMIALDTCDFISGIDKYIDNYVVMNTKLESDKVDVEKHLIELDNVNAMAFKAINAAEKRTYNGAFKTQPYEDAVRKLRSFYDESKTKYEMWTNYHKSLPFLPDDFLYMNLKDYYTPFELKLEQAKEELRKTTINVEKGIKEVEKAEEELWENAVISALKSVEAADKTEIIQSLISDEYYISPKSLINDMMEITLNKLINETKINYDSDHDKWSYIRDG